MPIVIEHDKCLDYLEQVLNETCISSGNPLAKIKPKNRYGGIFEDMAQRAVRDRLVIDGVLGEADRFLKPLEVEKVREAIAGGMDYKTIDSMHVSPPDLMIFSVMGEGEIWKLVAGGEIKGGEVSRNSLKKQFRGFVKFVRLLRHREDGLIKLREYYPEVKRLEARNPIPYFLVTTRIGQVDRAINLSRRVRGVKRIEEIVLDIEPERVREIAGLPIIQKPRAA